MQKINGINQEQVCKKGVQKVGQFIKKIAKRVETVVKPTEGNATDPRENYGRAMVNLSKGKIAVDSAKKGDALLKKQLNVYLEFAKKYDNPDAAEEINAMISGTKPADFDAIQTLLIQNGKSPLKQAIEANDKEMCKKLIDPEMPIIKAESFFEDGITPFKRAVLNGNREMVDKLWFSGLK